MKPIDFDNVKKIGTDENVIEKKQGIKKGDSKFDDILKAELDESDKTSKTGTDNIMPQTHILNIKPLSDNQIFAEKGLQLCSEVNNIFSNIADNLKSIHNIKGLMGQLSNIINDLSKISGNIEDKNVKELIDKTIFTSNIELEKYVRGDYS